jgi:hypothetical protein
MSQQGRYSPSNNEHTSSLWEYGEVPVTSAKLNTWNGNLQAALDFLHQSLAQILGASGSDFVLSAGSGDELQVVATTTPNMTVTIKAGAAWISSYLAGIDADETLPESGSFTAPTTNPRIDTMYISTSGKSGIETGIESVSPGAPSAPTGSLKIAEVYHRVGEASIQDSDDSVNGYITDTRPLRILGRAHSHPSGSERKPSESANGSLTAFSTPDKYCSGTLRVWLNGVEQDPDSDYSEDADRQDYTFVVAPFSGDRISHDYEKEGA